MNLSPPLPRSPEQPTSPLTAPTASWTPPALPLIELRQVVKVYQTAAGEFPALKGISAHIYPGEFVGVIG